MKRVALAIALLSALTTCAGAQSQTQPATPGSNPRAAQQQPPPAAVPTIPAPAESRIAPVTPEQRLDPNWIIAVLTLVLAIIAFRHWRTYEATLEAHKIIERAYVFPTKWEMSEEFKANVVTPRIIITLVNSGKTPATLIDSVMKFGVYAAPPAVPDFNDVRPVMFPLRPTGDWIRNVTLTGLTREQIDAINDRRLNLYTWGKVTYRDKFGSVRYTSWGMQYNPVIDWFFYLNDPQYNDAE